MRPSLEHLKFYAGTTLALARFQRVDRSHSVVQGAYEPHWNQYARYLERANSVEEWLSIPETDSPRAYYNRDGRLVSGKVEPFSTVNYYREQLIRAIRRHFPQARSVTEYGCGVGRNVIALQRALSLDESYGYELAEAGAGIANDAATKFRIPVRYAQLDYIRDPDDKFVFPVTDVAITCFSLEQIPHSAAIAVQRMQSRAHLGTVHIEPVAENYPLRVRGLLGRMYTWKHDYLRDFARIADSVSGVEVTKVVLDTAHNSLMFPSVYVLAKRGNRVAQP